MPIRTFLIVVGVIVSGAASGQSAIPETNAARIDAYLERSVETTRIPGAVALVADANGVLYAGAFGKRAVAADVDMTRDTIFRIASMTKPITSLAVMMLVEDGLVGLDDPIAEHVPELENPRVFDSFDTEDGSYTTRPAARPITVRHLLTHTSGLGYGFNSEILRELTDGGPGTSVVGLPLLHDPGERWTYGESTRVLGRLVERISGQPLDEFLRDRLFEPLGMEETYFTVPAADTERVATAHAPGENGLAEQTNPEQVSSPVRGDGGLSSTADDYAKFMQLFLRDGRTADGTQLVAPETIERMGENQIGALRVGTQPAAMPAVTRPFPLGAGRDTFGLGFQVTGEHDEPNRRSAGALSWAGIYNTQFWIDREAGICAVLLMQYLPFYDEAAIETLVGFERLVYEALEPE